MLNNRYDSLMKKILLLTAALCIAVMGYCQLPFATLSHNDSIRVFHGQNALQSAMSAAVGGDVINLSSGVFNACTINKAVTIRGAGMFNNDATGLINTTITGTNNFIVNVSGDTVNRLTLMGLYFAQNGNTHMHLRGGRNMQFVKCRFAYVGADQGTTDHAQFINCILQRWNNYGNTSSGFNAVGTSFYNSVILQYYNQYSPDILVNCIANLEADASFTNCKSILNSILYCNWGSNGSNNGYTSFNTIGINISTYYGTHPYFDLTNMATHNLHNYTSHAQVFQTFRGTYSDGMDMSLNDNIATTILGDDSTQVGIYGGQFPWDPSVSNPLIGHITAGRRTNAQGRLEVDVEIIDNDDNE